MSARRSAASPAVVWHDAECGAYAADLPLWEGLAREASGPVLELGCGTGRVALHLARAGFEVTALDRDHRLVAELERRAAAEGLELATLAADVGDFDLPGRFALIAAPMQLVHLLDDPGRARMLARASAHLRPGGRVAISLLAPQPSGPVDQGSAGLPDVVEIEGWVYSSLPVELRRLDDRLEVRRLRQVVSPAGELTEELAVTRLERLDVDRLERETHAAGLRPAGRRSIAPTAEHVGSTVVILEAL